MNIRLHTRRYWPLQDELLRRLDAYDELAKRAEQEVA